jgi:hypothetical protein
MAKKNSAGKKPDWRKLQDEADKLTGSGGSLPKSNEMPESRIAKVLRRQSRNAIAVDVLKACDGLRIGAGAVLDQFRRTDYPNRPLKPVVWIQLREELAERLAETAVDEVRSLLDTLTDNDFE